MSFDRTPENLRKIASGQQYPPAMVKRALQGAADDIEQAIAAIEERNRLLDNLTITIAAIVVCSGGEVEVPPAVLQGIEAFDLEKAPGADGGIVYRTKRKGSMS